jgi:hypothetical protein
MTKGGEFFVRAKGLLLLGRRGGEQERRSSSSSSRSSSRSSSSSDGDNGTPNKDCEDDDEITTVLDACRDDMIALWRDPVVREILHRRNIHLEEGPGL